MSSDQFRAFVWGRKQYFILFLVKNKLGKNCMILEFFVTLMKSPKSTKGINLIVIVSYSGDTSFILNSQL